MNEENDLSISTYFLLGLAFLALMSYLVSTWDTVFHFIGVILTAALGFVCLLLGYQKTRFHRMFVKNVGDPVIRKWRESRERWFVRYPLGCLPAYWGYQSLAVHNEFGAAIVLFVIAAAFMYEMVLLALGLYLLSNVFGVLSGLSRVEGMLLMIIAMLCVIIYDMNRNR